MTGVPVTPGTNDLAVLDLSNRAAMRLSAPVCRGDPAKVAPMGSRRRVSRHHIVSAGESLVDRKPQVWECCEIHLHCLPVAITTDDGRGERIRFPDMIFIEDLQCALDVMSIPRVPALAGDIEVVLLGHGVPPF